MATEEWKMLSRRMFRIAAVIVAAAIVPVHAAVTPQEAEKLKTTLTPLGADRSEMPTVPFLHGTVDIRT